MRIMTIHFSRLLCCALAATAVTLGASRASADTLTIDSSLSFLNMGILLGSYEGENPQEDPGSWQFFAPAVGQGLAMPIGGGPGQVTPGYSSGLSAQLGGTVDVTPGNFSIDGANAVPLDSGLWQPNGADLLQSPTAGQFGAYILADLFATNDTEVILRVFNSAFNFETNNLILDGFGNFVDANGLLELSNAFADAVFNTPFGVGGQAGIETGTQGTNAPLAGNYSGGVLTMPFSVTLPVDLAPSLDGAPLFLLFTLEGTIVTVVPEPSSIAMACSAMFGVVAYGVYGRRRRR